MKVGDITQIEPNIHAGVKYLRFVEDNYFNEPALTPVVRALFSFASYNAGPNRIQTLRKEAAKLVVADLAAQKGRDETKADFLSYTQVEGMVQYRVKPHVDVMLGYATVLSGKNATKRNELRLGVALKGTARTWSAISTAPPTRYTGCGRPRVRQS
jgi:hypothetical protein